MRRSLGVAITAVAGSALLAASLWIHAASQAVVVHYISPTGTASWAASTSPGSPASIQTANNNAVAGDSIVCAAGTYTAAIRPWNNGTASSRIVFAGNPADTAAAVFPGINFARDFEGEVERSNYVTVRWVRTTGGIDAGEYRASPSGAYLNSRNAVFVGIWVSSGSMDLSGRGHVVERVSVTNGSLNIMGRATPSVGTTQYRPGNIRMRNTRILRTDATSSDSHIHLRDLDDTRFEDCEFVVTKTGSAGEYWFGAIMYNGHNNHFLRCRLIATDNGATPGATGVFRLRDGSSDNSVTNCVIEGYGTNPNLYDAAFDITTSGDPSFGTCRRNRLEWSGIKSLRVEGAKAAVYGQAGLYGNTIRFNTIYTNSKAIACLGAMDSTVIAHNTCVAQSLPVIAVNDDNNYSGSVASRIVSNIFYSTVANSTPTGGVGAVVRVYQSASIESLGVVFARGGTVTNSVYRTTGAETGSYGTPGVTSGYGLAGKAIWGSPRFVDSTFTTFNATLGAGSYALTTTLHDGYAGAFGESPPEPCLDAGVPGLVTGFTARILNGQIAISGRAPGQSQYTGDETLTRIEIRRSLAPITTANWGAATLIDNPTLDDFGLLAGDNFTDLMIAPIPPEGTWYVAARGQDLEASGDGYGCVTSDTLTSPDQTRPAQVNPFTATALTPTTVRLSWTSVGEDSLTGTAASWTIRRSGSPILSESQWNTANQVWTQFSPAGPGQAQTFDVAFLTPGSLNWWAIRYHDAAGHAGAISPPDSATQPTETAPATRPAPITSLAASSPGNRLVRLSWTAPGNDSLTGTAVRYEVRFKRFTALTTALINDTLRAGATPFGQTYFLRGAVGDPPAPLVAGTPQSVTFAFDQGVASWWAIRTLGTSGVWSEWSNVDSTLTRVDSGAADWPATARVCYCGAQPTPNEYFVGSPFIKLDSVTVDTARIDEVAIANSAISFVPRMTTLDAIRGVAKYLHENHPTVDRSFEFTIDPVYMPNPSELTVDAPTYRWRLNYNARMWQAVERVTAWPANVARPYTTNYGKPLGYGAGSDTTGGGGWFWSSVAGRKNLLHTTGTGQWTGSAGIAGGNFNLALKVNGVFVLAESSAVIEADILNALTFVAANGETVHVATASLKDLDAWYTQPDNAGNGDVLDHVRAGYASRAALDSAWVEAKSYRARRLLELCPWLRWQYSNSDRQLGYQYANGSSREGFPMFGVGWQAEAWRLPGGAMVDLMLFTGRPRRGQNFDFPGTGQSGDSMLTAWSLDDAAVQQEIRFSGATASMFGLAHVFAPSKASAPSSGWLTHPYGWYGTWVFPHHFVNHLTGVVTKPGAPGAADWLGARVGFPYAHLPAAAGAAWSEDFTNGANPDSAGVGALTKNADGRLTIRPGGPPGHNFHVEGRTVRQKGRNLDYTLGLDAIAAVANWIPTVANQDLTVSGWVKADSAKWFGLFLMDSTFAAWGSTSNSSQRLWGTPTWQPFAYTVKAGATARRVRPYFTFADTVGVVRFAGLQVHRGDSTMWLQEFERGVVAVNPSVNALGHTFGRMTRGITDVYETVNRGALSRSIALSSNDGRFLLFAADSVRPAQPAAPAVSNVRCNTALLGFVASGDDSLSGAISAVDVRISTSAINEVNFDLATPAWYGTPLGALGDQVIPLAHLAAATTYHVAFRPWDEAGFRGLVSPDATFTTLASCVGIAKFEGK